MLETNQTTQTEPTTPRASMSATAALLLDYYIAVRIAEPFHQGEPESFEEEAFKTAARLLRCDPRAIYGQGYAPQVNALLKAHRYTQAQPMWISHRHNPDIRELLASHEIPEEFKTWIRALTLDRLPPLAPETS
jgi:hypothetical protein